MNDRFFSLQLFARVARTGSFSSAGREMGISQRTASGIVAVLEKKVGVPLLTRSTRPAMRRAGLGLLSAGDLSVLTELETGSLVRVLPEWEMGSADINAILLGGPGRQPSARAFAEFVAAELEDVRAQQASVWQSSK